MTNQLKWSTIRVGSFLVIAGGLPACGADHQPTTPVVVEGQELAAILNAAIQDEYHAEAVYEGVLADFGQVAPFSNILHAEVRHSTAIAKLYQSRGWSVPASIWVPSNVPHFETLSGACAAGAEAEVANVAVYDGLMAGVDLPADIMRVFSSNRIASQERHLPAFQRCAS